MTRAAAIFFSALLCSAPGCEEPRAASLLLVDQNAGPTGHGALFRIADEGESATLFATSELLRQPQDVLQEDDGSLLVLDYYGELGTGKIFRFSPDGKTCAEVKLPPGLVDPYQFERHADGSIWIVDKNADPLGLGKKVKRKTGTIWRLSRDLQTLEVIASGPPLAAPSAILFAGDDVLVMDADAGQGAVFDPNLEEGAIFRVHKHPKALEEVVRFQKLMSPLGALRRDDGTFLVIDVNADPVQRDRHRGAVYVVDPKSKTTKLFADHPDFRDPVNGTMWRGAFLVADANADPLNLGADGSKYHFAGNGRGAIYAVDPDTRKVRLFVASKQFVNPVRLRTVEL